MGQECEFNNTGIKAPKVVYLMQLRPFGVRLADARTVAAKINYYSGAYERCQISEISTGLKI